MANYVKRTIRLNPSQARSLSGIADRRGLSEYAMLLKVIDAGFLSVLHGTDKETDLADLAREIGAISERLAEAERVSDGGAVRVRRAGASAILTGRRDIREQGLPHQSTT